jgi:hypothetical protein
MRLAHADKRRMVVDDLGSLSFKRLHHSTCIAQIDSIEGDSRRQMLWAAVRGIVEHRHVAAAREVCAQDVHADEAQPAGEQDALSIGR